MSIENMKRISEAEEQAVSIRRQAQTDVRKTAEKGRKDAADLLGRIRGEAEALYRSELQKAEAEAQVAYDRRLEEVAAECSAMKVLAEKRIPDAVSLITGKVVSASGIS